MSAVESKKNLETRAMRYLVRREYSRQELAQKLSTNANASDSQELETVLDALEQKGFLSAQRVVEQTAHLRRARYGSQRIIHELKTKGIDAHLIDEIVPTLQATENETASTVWQKKFGRLPATREEYAKQMRFMMSRGFSVETVRKILTPADDV
ncbi:MAG TPA: recombination regulator RecX [Nitrosomonas sp.]|nr:recombination regulator RecX [Nitrosomonas sp.]HQX13200.1 recombination regulator RecX [Nitrosomonas sp.]HRB32077.1 recombination regulator RecX [Nitrosomonas sp.]HRB45473.1 recombination regulator RecX [Nitrosomonas sp.]HRB77011.1 recombination regulator RecX [Nitrosomonas sp.]